MINLVSNIVIILCCCFVMVIFNVIKVMVKVSNDDVFSKYVVIYIGNVSIVFSK